MNFQLVLHVCVRVVMSAGVHVRVLSVTLQSALNDVCTILCLTCELEVKSEVESEDSSL